VARFERGQRHVSDRFRALTPAQVRYYGAHGVLAEMCLFDLDEDAIYWLRWRRQDGIETGRAVRANWTDFRASCCWATDHARRCFPG
jgi:hypothetical protein